jgi:hypothetical protein
MNDNDPTSQNELPPLDAFEQQWVDQLAQREPDLKQTEDAFIQSVMQAEAASAAGAPAVLARIGSKPALPYAAAAAVVLAAFIGWYVLKGEPASTPSEQPIANETNNTLQPDVAPAVAETERPKVELGKLIARATTTNPTAQLTNTVSEMPDTLSVDRLFDLLGDSVPDLKKLLAPLEPKNEQSRA